MTDPIIKRLNDRMARYYHRTGRTPKRLSVSHTDRCELMQQCSAGGMLYAHWKTHSVRFCGVPVRVRNYKRERMPKWHGPGAMLP